MQQAVYARGTATALGANANAAGEGAAAMGSAASAPHDDAVALGRGVTTTTTDQVNIGTKRALLGAPNSAPADADLINGQISFWLNEADNTIVIKAKYSTGVVKTFLGALI